MRVDKRMIQSRAEQIKRLADTMAMNDQASTEVIYIEAMHDLLELMNNHLEGKS